jgi:hypothetical protein
MENQSMHENKDEIWAHFHALWHDINQDETFPNDRPILAHYTSVDSLEKIMSGNELWFSNPLYMNDLDELRFGINEGVNAFRKNQKIMDACNSAAQYKALSDAFEYAFDQFSNKHVLDTYVFCLAEHKLDNRDGLLSMWRGYGGNGHSAALVFDTSKFEYIEEGSPLTISKVEYFTKEERLNWIDGKLTEFATLLSKMPIRMDRLYLPAYALFERLKTFALFTKHHGFLEEKEWRIVYQIERDKFELFDHMLHYAIGQYGVEPKLKFKVQPIEGLTTEDLSLETVVTEIILGPTISSPMAIRSVSRMLEKVGKHALADRVFASTIPFRL